MSLAELCRVLVCASLLVVSAPASQEQHKQADPQEVECLASVIYFEAGNQGYTGRVAVAFVVLNRTERMGKTICEVVTQKSRGGSCQFVGRCGQSNKKRVIRWPKMYRECQELASRILAHPDGFTDPTNGATHFHADYVLTPKWAYRGVRTAHIGRHIFYRLNL